MSRSIHSGRVRRQMEASVLVVAGVWLAGGCAGVKSPSVPAAPPAGPSAILPAAADTAQAAQQILVTVKLKSSWRVPAAGSGGSYATGYRASARTERVVSELANSYHLQEVSSWPILVLGVHCVVFEIPSGSTADEVVSRLADDTRVESVQAMNVFEAKANDYNDPYLELQHGVSSMQVREAHQWARGVGVQIAVIDTGVDIDHPELRDHIRLAQDFVQDDGKAPSADHHGTAVAGVIVSTVDNGIGIIGVAPAARILALKACWQESRDSPLGVCNSFTLAKALSFAIERKPHILNLSLAGPPDPLLERLVRAALDSGIVVVAAASDVRSEAFPCNVDGVLGVRSAEGYGNVATLISSRDPDLLAPGTDIITTSPTGGFDFLSGNSLATAHVSGVVALLLERQPSLSGPRLYALLRDTSRPGDEQLAGMPPVVNACAAVSRVISGPECLPAN